MGASDDDALSLSGSSMSGLEDEEGEEVAGPQASPSRWGFSAADDALLVKVVKIVQKRNITGKHGIWKEFVVVRSRNLP